MIDNNTNLNEMVVFVKNNVNNDNLKKFRLRTQY